MVRIAMGTLWWVSGCIGLTLLPIASFANENVRLRDPAESDFYNQFPSVIDQLDSVLQRTETECDAICGDLAGWRYVAGRDHHNLANAGARDWYVLPDGLLWHSYLAGPHEPRISTVIFNDTDNGVFWDATLGGRVGLIRYGTFGAKDPRGLQWDLEGAVATRLDLHHAEDVESMDYRFGTEITAAEGRWAMKFGYFHISSHVGDEYMVRNPLFQRTNYVTESWVIGLRYAATESIQVYGEMANAFSTSGGAKRYQYQTGFEYTPIATSFRTGAPFAAVNLNFREAVNYDVSTTVQFGWAFQGLESQRRFRVGLQYAEGPTSQYEFFTRREEYIGVGVWFDY
mgnify:CR=1 FL=1|tara:strand:- start:2932 stop:3957 length:1026 start_codon:yes stop_codon:yes gene_type:complete